MKDKKEDNDGDDDEWESAEEDVPHIKLEELKSLADQLAGMNIEGEEEEPENDEEVAESGIEESKQ